MSIQRTYSVTLSGGEGFFQQTTQLAASGSAGISEAIPDSSTDLDLAFSAPNAIASDSVKALGLLADQDLTVKITEADNTLLESIALTANEPYVWAEGVTDPTWHNAGDIGKLRVTNASGSAATLSADILFDSTP